MLATPQHHSFPSAIKIIVVGYLIHDLVEETIVVGNNFFSERHVLWVIMKKG